MFGEELAQSRWKRQSYPLVVRTFLKAAAGRAPLRAEHRFFVAIRGEHRLPGRVASISEK